MMGFFLGPTSSGLWLMMISMALFYIIFLVTLWRIAKTHESIARSMKNIADSLRSKNLDEQLNEIKRL